MSVNNIDSIQGISAMELGSMDLETALLAVQNQRSQLLEGQLKGQIDAVQTKNDEIAKMNEGMNASQAQLGKVEAQILVNEARIQELTAMRDQLTQVQSRDPSGWTGLSWGWAGDDKTKSLDMLQRVRAEGLTDRGPAPRDVDNNGTMDAHGSTLGGWIDQLNTRIDTLKTETAGLKQAQIDLKDSIADTKSGIDSLSNSQQMDMLRLQSLSNKRNEAFDVMTNFIKKMQDNRSSILGNMR